MTPNHGDVYWSELNTWEPEKAAAFLEKTLGWAIEEMPMEDGAVYRVGMIDGRPAGGVFPLTSPMFDKDMPSHWLTYFAVDDVDASVATVAAEGGSVLRAPFDVPGTGRVAIIEDPTGGVCGLITPAPTPEG